MTQILLVGLGGRTWNILRYLTSVLTVCLEAEIDTTKSTEKYFRNEKYFIYSRRG